MKSPEVKTSQHGNPVRRCRRRRPSGSAGEIVAALKTVFDPEIPADIYELGLIYKVDIKDDRADRRDDDPDDAELSGGRRTAADHGGECGRQRARRRRGQCQSGLGSGLDAGPDERRGPPRPQYVVKRVKTKEWNQGLICSRRP